MPSEVSTSKPLDPKQQEAAACLAEQAALLNHPPFFARRQAQGIYLWGGVGRGKTFLIDQWFSALHTEKKKRLHMHDAFLLWQDRLNTLQGHASPLQKLAQEWARDYRVLCIDDLMIHDLPQALIIGPLLQALWAEGVFVAISSNIAPQHLYENGLQRALFMPSIACIQKKMIILSLDPGPDYRVGSITKKSTYYWQEDAAVPRECFLQSTINDTDYAENGLITVSGRALPFIQKSHQALHCDFQALCESPRSAMDYVALAQEYHVLFISQIPILDQGHSAAVRRFIHAVDVWTDRGLTLKAYGAVPLDQLYQGEQCRFEWARLQSRLQSSEAF